MILYVKRHLFFSCFALLIAVFTCSVIGTAAPFDEFWSDKYNSPGVNGTVKGLTPLNGGVFVCGSFYGIGNTNVHGIGLLTRDGDNYQITPYGDSLFYATGTVVEYDRKFTVAGGEYDSNGEKVYGVFQWSGGNWNRLGRFPRYCYDLAVYDEQLYSTGGVWDGTLWQVPYLTDGYIFQVVVHDGLLYCAGQFNTVNGDSISNIFAWDGSQVLPLEEGFPYTIRSMIVQGGGVVVQGSYGMNGGLIRRWDGTSWTTLLDGGRTAEAVGVLGGDLVAGTYWQETPGMSTVSHPELMHFNNGVWTKLGEVDARHMVNFGGSMYIGHRSDIVAGTASPGLAVYEDSTFTAPIPDGWGFDYNVHDLTLLDNRIVVAGHYHYGGGIADDDCFIEEATGGGWTPLNNVNLTSMFGFLGFRSVAAAGSELFGIYAIDADDYAIPVLVKLDQSNPNNQVWNRLGTSWVAYDDKLIAVGSELYVLRIYDHGGFYWIDQTDGEFYNTGDLNVNGYVKSACDLDGQAVIAGDWTTQNGAPATSVLILDGETWHDFGPAPPEGVRVVAPAGPGALAVAFNIGEGDQIAISDGGPWQTLNGLFNARVDALVFHQERLAVAGNFLKVDTTDVPGIAVWTGSSWAPVGSGLKAFPSSHYGIKDMISTDHGLFIAGYMNSSGGRNTKGLAVWSGDLRQIPDNLSPVPDDQWIPSPSPLQAVPNPFNPRTVITWEMPRREFATLDILDVRGRLVRTIWSDEVGPGPARVAWDGRDTGGRNAPSGIYFAQLNWAGQSSSRKLTLIR
ncbi:MAG: FlgD immunoglobulin-like domain containing protein [Candidatus Krumholzibacteriota bacterium]